MHRIMTSILEVSERGEGRDSQGFRIRTGIRLTNIILFSMDSGDEEKTAFENNFKLSNSLEAYLITIRNRVIIEQK